MKKTAITLVALPVAALVLASPAHANLCFTSAETRFLRDVASLGIGWSNDQDEVDAGWSVVYDTQHGVSVHQEAVTMFTNSHIGQGPAGITMIQASGMVAYALTDLSGTSPSPGGTWHDANTPHLGACGGVGWVV